MVTRFLLLLAPARNLTFIYDSHLSFSDHISSVSRACFYIHDLCPRRDLLDFDIGLIIMALAHLLFTTEIRCTIVFFKRS